MSLWDSWLRWDLLKAIGRVFASRHRYLLPPDPECCVDRLNRHGLKIRAVVHAFSERPSAA